MLTNSTLSVPISRISASNSYVDILIATGISKARNQIIIASSDAVVSVCGGAGTLSEIAFAWQLEKPIVSLAYSGGWSEKLANTQLDDSREGNIVAASSPSDAVNILNRILVL